MESITGLMIELLNQYGYIIIFLFLVLGIFALPLPDELMMLMLGALTSFGILALLPTFISAVAGSICGVTISYKLGKRFGYPLLYRHGPRIYITHKRLEGARRLFRKHGSILLFFGYFIPGVRQFTAYFAGISGHSYIRFALVAYTGATLWCGLFVGLGYVLGANYLILAEELKTYSPLVATALLLAILGYWGFHRWRKKRLPKDPPPPPDAADLAKSQKNSANEAGSDEPHEVPGKSIKATK